MLATCVKSILFFNQSFGHMLLQCSPPEANLLFTFCYICLSSFELRFNVCYEFCTLYLNLSLTLLITPSFADSLATVTYNSERKKERNKQDSCVFLIFHHILNTFVLSLSSSSGPNKPHCHSCVFFRKLFHSSVGNVIKVFSEIPWVQRLRATCLSTRPHSWFCYLMRQRTFFSSWIGVLEIFSL